MKIVISGETSLLGRALAKALAGAHEIVLLGGDPRDEAAARQALDGAEALVHLAPLYPELPADVGDGWRRDRELLDYAARGTFVVLNAAVEAGVRRVVLGSTLALMERYPAHWAVSEAWQPLPDATDVWQLAAYLAEESAKQLAHVEPLEVVCLRFGTVVEDVEGQPYDPRWVHVEDAVQACEQALVARLGGRPEHAGDRITYGWWLFHIPGGGRYTRLPLAAASGERGLGYRPQHDFAGCPGADAILPQPPPSEAANRSALAPRERLPSRPIRNVVIFGAGGPLAAATAPLLAPSYRLRLTDVRPMDEIIAAGPRGPGQPVPEVLGPPHETMPVDVTDLDQVLRACEGMDAIVNCTVVRPHPVDAFLVNTIGAYHVMRAAVAHRVRRVVHTGPLQVLNDRQAGYAWDFDIPDEAPPRPGAWLYLHTKYLGQEIVRRFAEQFDLEVPALLYCNFVNPQTARGPINPMTVSWDDAGHAMRRAVEVPSLPTPFEIFHVLADLPHGKYSGEKAYRLLGWSPRDDLSHLWATREQPQ